MRREIVEEKHLGRVNNIRMLVFVPLLFLVTSIFYGLYSSDIKNVIEGFLSILSSPTLSITDFLEVGGIGGALLNASLVGFFNIYIINRYKLKINGLLIAAFFTVIGFSFFGKNIYNILPIYLGGYLYTKYQKIHFKDIIAVIMFSTALAPLISELTFLGLFGGVWDILLAIIVGTFVGFVIVPLSSSMIKFHDGYNLYNVGFTTGIIGTVVSSILITCGVNLKPTYIVSENNQAIIIVLITLILTLMFIVGMYINKNALKDYKKILKYKGRLITDYTHLVGYGITFVNMALLGFMSLIFVLLTGGVVNGPVIAGIFTVVGFGALGKHLRNVISIELGVIAVALIFGFELSSTSVLITVLFSTTLAPIAGEYGPIIGFFTGMIHMFLVRNIGIMHSGLTLYNNGFAGGIVAAVMVPIIDAFKKDK